MNRVNLLLGGPVSQWPEVLSKDPASIPGEWLGVDRGTLRLLNLGLTPKLAVGDFDSLKADELQRVSQAITNIHYAKPEKDDTDSELALSLAFDTLKADEVVIYGATGARLDHFLVNLYMLLEPRFKQHLSQVDILDCQNSLHFYEAGRHEIHQEIGKQYLAFINLTPVQDFSILDAKYQLHHANLDYSRAYASNEFLTDTVHFEFQGGVMLTIQSSD